MARVLALFAVLAAAVQEDEAGKLLSSAREKLSAGRHAAARPLFQEYLRRFPQTPGAPEALYHLARCYGNSPDENAAAVECLRRLHREYPDHPHADRAAEEAGDRAGWSFSQVPFQMAPGSARDITVSRHGRPRSTYTVYRVPGPAHREVFEKRIREGVARWVPPSRRHTITEAFGEFDEDERSTRTFRIPLLVAGLYYIEEEIDGFRRIHTMRAPSFGISVKAVPGRTVVYAVDPWSGNPRADLLVEFLFKDRSVAARTGPDGRAVLEGGSPLAVVATRHEEVWTCELGEEEPGERPLVYITTDRPIYRPGQTVHYKALRRDLRKESLANPPPGNVRVELRDPGGRILHSGDHAWNEAGSLSGSFRLGDEPPLGDYQVVVHVPNPDAYEWDGGPAYWKQRFEVAAYRKPEIRVAVEFPDAAPVRGARVRARLRAQYYFGGPAAGAEVEWAAHEYVDEDGRAPSGRAPFEDPRGWVYAHEDSDDPAFPSRELARGTGRTGADGTLEVAFDTEAGSHPAIYFVDATVRDLSRLTAEGQGRVQAFAAAVRPVVGTPRLFYRPGDRVVAQVRLTTAGGKPAADRAVDVTAFLTAPAREEEFESCFSAACRTDADGRASVEFPVDRAGRLRLRVRAKDDAGREAEDRADLWVAGDEAWREGELDQHDIDVLPDRLVYEEGETIRLMVRTPLKPLDALLTFEGGETLDSRVVRLKSRCEILEFPARREHAPNVLIKLLGWKQGTAAAGGYQVHVLPKGKFLHVEVKTERAVYGPRQKARVTVTTRAEGRPVPAEVELGIVDESIFALAKDRARDIRRFFYPARDGAFLSSTLGARDAWDAYDPRGARGGGVLVGATFALAEEGGEADRAVEFAHAETRRWFPDTLFWRAHLETGPDGRAELDVETPDSLTTWRLTARAASGTDRFGAGVSSAVTRKDVIVRLTAPRFYTERDEGTVSTIVHNDLAAETEFTVRLSCQGGEADAEPRRVTVPARSVARLDWKVRAVRPGSIVLRAEALSRLESDAMELTVPVRPHGLERQIVKAGRVEGTWKETIVFPPEEGREAASLEVQVSGAGMSAVLGALPYLAGYPYGCVEQTMSRFLPAVVASRALKKLGVAHEGLARELPDMVNQGLQRLYGFQHKDGGWGWWKHDSTHPFMTAYVVYGLSVARAAGYPVDPKTFERGLEALRQMSTTPFSLYARRLAGDDVAQDLREGRFDTVEDRAYLVLAGRKDLAAGLPARPPESGGPQNIRSFALVLRALASVDPDDPRVAAIADWLMLQRRGSAWVSTLDTACAVYAFTDLASREREPDFKLLLNGEAVAAPAGRAIVSGGRLRAGPNRIEVSHAGQKPLYAAAALRYYTQGEQPAPEQGGLVVTRRFERAVQAEGERRWEHLESGSEVKVGEEIRVVLTVRAESEAERVLVESPIPAGCEPRQDEPDEYDWLSSWYGRREMRDDRVAVAAAWIGRGSNEFTFRLRPTLPGRYHVLPAYAFGMYDPDLRATSGEFLLRVRD